MDIQLTHGLENMSKNKQGTIGTGELKAALSLDKEIKGRIAQYEKENWAANLSTPVIQEDWRQFLRRLESALKSKSLDDEILIELIQHLSTQDSVALIDQIGKLNASRQSRFINLLNWVSDSEDAAESLRNGAVNVRERILMAYRMKQYPNVYSTQRLDRAIRLQKQDG